MFAEIDFDSLSLSPAPQADSSAVVPRTSSHEDGDVINALRSQLADSNQALESLKKIVKDRLGNEMGLADIAREDEKTIVHSLRENLKGKGKIGKDGEERDDDSHYFESYSYNGSSFFLSPVLS